MEQGLLEATDAKQVGHLTETYYQAVKDMESFNIENEFAKENSEFVIKQLLMRVNKNIEALKADFDKEQPEAIRSQASLQQADLSWKEWQSLNAEMRELVDKRGREAKSSKDEKKLSINYILMSYADEEGK